MLSSYYVDKQLLLNLFYPCRTSVLAKDKGAGVTWCEPEIRIPDAL